MSNLCGRSELLENKVDGSKRKIEMETSISGHVLGALVRVIDEEVRKSNTEHHVIVPGEH